MTHTADVAIIGLGAMGSAVALELARRGVRVVGFDAESIPNTRSSHHGGTRAIRLAYAEHPDYVPLLRRAFDRWLSLQEMLGETVVDLVGGLYMGDPKGPFVSGVRRAVTEHGLAHEHLGPDELARRFPQIRCPDGTEAILERQAGSLRCERIVTGHARLASSAGAELHGHVSVRGWKPAGPENAGGMEIETDRGTWHAGRIVVTAGPWSSHLLAELDLPLTVTRQVSGWFVPARSARFSSRSLPVWGIETGHGELEYGFPSTSERPGVKYARHAIGRPVDPDSVERAVSPAERDALIAAADARLDGGVVSALSVQSCLYTNTPDGHPIVGIHPADRRVVFAAGFSGHGFKFASVLGTAIADLVTQDATREPIGFLSPEARTSLDPAFIRSGGDTRST